MDNFTGTSGNDTYIADNTGTNTTGLADVLNGGAGTDSLTIYGFATADGVPQISNIENIVLDNSAAGSTISLVNATGVSSVTVQAAVGATDTTVASGVTVTLKSNADATTAQVVDFGATATSASLVLNGVTTNTTVDVEAQGAAVTTLNIATTGAASTVGQLEVDAAMKTVVITGDKDLTITDAVEEAVETINASAFTGKLNVKTADQATTPDATVSGVDVTDITVTGGSNNDTIDVSAQDDDVEISVNAGAGDDKVVYVKTANRAEDWRHVFLELAQEHPDASLETLHLLSLEESARRKSGILTASRAVSVKHTDWSHEIEIRLLAPKSGALPVLGEVLKRVHYVRTDGEHWGAIMQLLRAYYPTVETTHWQFNHGVINAIPTPMEIRLVPV